jgi:DNA modification methylase
MPTIDQTHTPDYSLYNGDCCEVIRDMPDESIHLSVYSPPFATKNGQGLFVYSSSERDFSNSKSYEDFFDQYAFLVAEIKRITKPGCFSAVHCMDVPFSCNLGNYISDFPGDIIRLHQDAGFVYVARHTIWKEPLCVRNRTMAKGLAHKTIVDNANLCDVAGADYLLMFRKKGDRETPVTYPTGLHEYYGAQLMDPEFQRFRGWTGDQKENRYSHWIWRRYASAIWDDIRGNLGEFDDRKHKDVLEYESARDADDERHVHPLQLDVIARAITLRSNPGDTVFTPFMGVGSEVYQAVRMARKAFGIELQPSYYRQAVKNCATAKDEHAKEVGLLPLE